MKQIIETIQNQIIVALEGYIYSIILMQRIFTELHAETGYLYSKMGQCKDSAAIADNERKIKRLYGQTLKQAKEIGGSLQQVVHIFNETEQMFKALKEFSGTE